MELQLLNPQVPSKTLLEEKQVLWLRSKASRLTLKFNVKLTVDLEFQRAP